MIEPGNSEQFSLALVNALLLALWPALPGLLLGFLRQSAALRRVRAEFSLRDSERRELDRARQLYREVRSQLTMIERTGPPAGFWRRLFVRKSRIGPDDTEALEDLRAHAEVLHEIIVRLQRRPLQRLKSWMRLVSSKAALSRALAAYIVGFVLLLVVFRIPDQPAWAGDLTTGARAVLSWYPFDGRFFYANAVAAGFAAGAAALFYASQWATLRRDYGCEFSSFGELARSDPDFQQSDVDQFGAADQASATVAEWAETADGWCAVLGLPPTASIDDIKEAYKRRIKQNHPDRVHGLSAPFQRLAEAETQKLNAALRQALSAACRPDKAASRRDQAA